MIISRLAKKKNLITSDESVFKAYSKFRSLSLEKNYQIILKFHLGNKTLFSRKQVQEEILKAIDPNSQIWNDNEPSVYHYSFYFGMALRKKLNSSFVITFYRNAAAKFNYERSIHVKLLSL